MDITLQYFDGCPNWEIALERLMLLTAERTDIAVTKQRIDTVDDAERVGFHGSPSILIDGTDVFADASMQVGLACRRYMTPEGPAGAPTIEQLRATLPIG